MKTEGSSSALVGGARVGGKDPSVSGMTITTNSSVSAINRSQPPTPKAGSLQPIGSTKFSRRSSTGLGGGGNGSASASGPTPILWSDWIISKICVLPLTWGIMALTIYFGRKAFLAHVFLLTFLLLLILYKINGLYGSFENPYYTYFITVLCGGCAHVLIPIIATAFQLHTAMYAHLGVCFIVHVLHLSQCAYVFQDITFKDEEFILILWAVNICEMIVNIVYVFDHIFPRDEYYIACAVAVQAMALMIVNLHLKPDVGGTKHNHIIHDNSSTDGSNHGSSNHNYNNSKGIHVSDDMLSSGKDSTSIQSNYNYDKPTPFPPLPQPKDVVSMFSMSALQQSTNESLIIVWTFIHEHVISRTVLATLSSISIVCMNLFPRYRFLIFMITMSFIMRLAVLKVRKACKSYPINFLVNIVLIVAPIGMIGFASLIKLKILTHGIGVTLCTLSLLSGMILLFFALFTITAGQCSTARMSFVMMVMAMTSCIFCLVQGEHYHHYGSSKEVLLFACLAIATSILFFLTKIHVVVFAHNMAAIGANGPLEPSKDIELVEPPQMDEMKKTFTIPVLSMPKYGLLGGNAVGKAKIHTMPPCEAGCSIGSVSITQSITTHTNDNVMSFDHHNHVTVTGPLVMEEV